MKSIIAIASIVTVAGAAMPSAAQVLDPTDKSGAYGNLGYTHSSSGDGHTNSITGRAGWRFNRFLGVEGEGSVGVSGDGGSFIPPGGTTATQYDTKQQYQLAGYGVGYLPLSPKFDLFARVGYGTNRYKVDVAGGPDSRFNQESWNWGGGAQYLFDGANGVRAEYTRSSMQDDGAPPNAPWAGKDQDNWSISYVRQF
jgi:hypothetical protein